MTPEQFKQLAEGNYNRIPLMREVLADMDTPLSAYKKLADEPYTYLLESIFPHPSLLECLKGAAHIIAGDRLQYEEGEELTLAQAIEQIQHQ